MSNLFNVSAISVSESSSDDEEYMEEYDVQQQSSIHSFVWNANKNSRNNDRASAVSTKPSSTASTSSSPLGFLGGRVGASHLKKPLDGIFTQQQARVGAKKKEITVIDANELNIDLSRRTKIIEINEPQQRERGEIVQDVDELIDRLGKSGVLNR